MITKLISSNCGRKPVTLRDGGSQGGESRFSPFIPEHRVSRCSGYKRENTRGVSPGYFIAGIDEAGRGPLAGPVVAAAVILNPKNRIKGLNDSKKLTAKQREALYLQIIEKALSYGIAQAEVAEIDQHNIHQATMLAMQRAFALLTVTPTLAFVDGKCTPKLPVIAEAIVRGDQRIHAISAASILAKVFRDQWMTMADLQYPGYGFAKHKGYGTVQHQKALQELGVTPIHRQSFAPVKQIIEAREPKKIINQELDLQVT